MKRRLFSLFIIMMLLAVGAWQVPAAAVGSYELVISDDNGERVLTGYSGTLPGILQIPEGVTIIGTEAFKEAEDLEQVIIPSGVTAIREGAFMDCPDLEQVMLPPTLMSIGIGAFSCCKALASVDFPDSVSEIAWGAFSGCTKLQSVVLPPKLISVSTNAFCGCDHLTSVTLPQGLEYLGGYCFADCDRLESIVLPDSLLSLQDGVFKGCDRLLSLVIPEGPNYLSYTFADCKALKTVTIPASVVQIEGSVFNKCDALETVYYGGTREAWDHALTYGNSSLHSKVNLICLGMEPTQTPSEQPSESPAPTEEPTETPTSLPEPGPSSGPSGELVAPALKSDSGYEIVETDLGLVLEGIEIGRSNEFTSVAQVASAFDIPDGTSVEIFDAVGEVCEAIAPIATGDQIALQDSRGSTQTVVVIVPGDVVGSGLLDITQLVRMAKALNGSVPLEGPFLAAGRLTGNESISITDLVRLAHELVERA